MEIVLLSKLLQDKGWQINQKRRGHHSLDHTLRTNNSLFILPDFSSGLVPTGTLTAIVRLAHARRETQHWTSFVNGATEINVILEKQNDVLWGRIEIPGLLIATHGCNAECVSNSLRALLIEFAVEDWLHYCAAIASVPLIPVYDTTAVWSVVKQLKVNNIAEQVGVDMELLGQFMTGNTYPCSEVAIRLEKSIHELGRQLMQVSIR